MILSVKNRFICICLLLGLTLPATGQVYMTSKAKIHSVSTSGVGNDSWNDNVNHGNKYGPSSSFRSTSSHISAGPSYSVSVPSVSVKTSFTTAASSIGGGITLADQVSTLTTDFGLDGPNKGPGGIAPPTEAPIGDIPWVILLLACGAFAVVKGRRSPQAPKGGCGDAPMRK